MELLKRVGISVKNLLEKDLENVKIGEFPTFEPFNQKFIFENQFGYMYIWVYMCLFFRLSF